MKIVVDVNVILSSLLGKGKAFDVFAMNSIFRKFDFIAPEFMIHEFKKHKQKILEMSKLSKEIFEHTLEFVLNQIEIMQESEFSDLIPDAKEHLSEHPKDIQYLALALKLNCPIFSGDKRLKEFSPVNVISPSELLKEFSS